MRRNVILILLLVSVSASSCFLRKKKSKDAVLMRFLKMEEYCGGAAPAPDMMKELMTPKPFADTILYLYQMDGEESAAPIKVKTNRKGEASMVVPPGHYTVMLFPRTKIDEIRRSKEYEGIDSNCLKDFFMQGLHDIPIPEGMLEIEVPVLIRCNPCLPPKP